MSMSILNTKLYIPATRPDVVTRQRLLEALTTGVHRKLTLVSAPAGFGKTTLLSHWLDKHAYTAAWVSLDEGDNEPLRFLSYLIAALQSIQSSVGQTIIEQAQNAQHFRIEPFLTTLLNDITTMPHDFVVVLDDYHLITNAQIDNALSFLLNHLPPQMHLVIVTREDPQLPLARWRAQGQLNELRIADLRFNAEEAAAFLNQAMGLALAENDILALEKRTEGWIAGLQLAALSIQGRTNSSSFITAFTGSNRFVLDYLVEEVLQRQPDAVRTFLLKTSILEQLSISLCNAVTQRDNSNATLDTLERDNLFIIPLDDQRHWYRYHHLFADALRANLMQLYSTDEIEQLHLRASQWYTTHELPSAAIRHALAANAFHDAADLIELVWPEMDENYRSATWGKWVQALPEDIIAERPLLSLGYAWALLNQGQLGAAEERLHAAEKWLNTPNNNDTPMVVLDEERFRRLPAAIAGARAYRALTLGDTATAIRYAQRAIKLSTDVGQTSHRQGTSLLGIAHWARGELAIADELVESFMLNMVKIRNLNDAMIIFILAEIRMTRGQLRSIFKAYDLMLDALSTHGEPLPIGAADLYRGLAELYLERNDLEAAAEYLQQAERNTEQITLPNWQHRLHVTQARVKRAMGELDDALTLLDRAAQLYSPSPLPDTRPIAAQKARIWIRQAKLDNAATWAFEHGLTIEDELHYLHEFEYITLARLLIAQQHTHHDALQHALYLLKRLEQAAAAGTRIGNLIEILCLQALAHAASGDTSTALIPLQRALTLAEPEGYIRVFTDEGQPMAALLRIALEEDITPDYVAHLQRELGTASPHPSAAFPTPHQLEDPLSDREMDVLKLLNTDLSGPEIARELVVSVNTVRTHTKNIYSKLYVNSRRAAVRRAKELGLL